MANGNGTGRWERVVWAAVTALSLALGGTGQWQAQDRQETAVQCLAVIEQLGRNYEAMGRGEAGSPATRR